MFQLGSNTELLFDVSCFLCLCVYKGLVRLAPTHSLDGAHLRNPVWNGVDGVSCGMVAGNPWFSFIHPLIFESVLSRGGAAFGGHRVVLTGDVHACLVETVFGWGFRGIESFQDFLGGAEFRPSTIGRVGIQACPVLWVVCPLWETHRFISADICPLASFSIAPWPRRSGR